MIRSADRGCPRRPRCGFLPPGARPEGGVPPPLPAAPTRIAPGRKLPGAHRPETVFAAVHSSRQSQPFCASCHPRRGLGTLVDDPETIEGLTIRPQRQESVRKTSGLPRPASSMCLVILSHRQGRPRALVLPMTVISLMPSRPVAGRAYGPRRQVAGMVEPAPVRWPLRLSRSWGGIVAGDSERIRRGPQIVVAGGCLFRCDR